MIPLLLSTLLFRWYVFFFWFVGLGILSRSIGVARAFTCFLGGYGIAYFCEWSSARPGGWFPFGHYVYLPTTLHRELWIGLLPLMDSLSFDFLAVGALGLSGLSAGYSLRETLTLPVRPFLRILLRGILLFVMIDMVIDPVALRGNRWFLGRIYKYPEGGAYFGVTLSNFLGWAVTGFLIMLLWRLLLSVLPLSGVRGKRTSFLDRGGPVFIFAAVYFFNLSVAVYLREWGIVLADLLLGSIVAGAIRRGSGGGLETRVH